jgi:hypothetical protein
LTVVDNALMNNFGTRGAQVFDRSVVSDRWPSTQQTGRGDEHRTGAHGCDDGAGLMQVGQICGDFATLGFGSRTRLAVIVPPAARHQD